MGRNPDSVRKHTHGDSRIELVGPVQDAIQEIAKAKIAVVPLLSGSGTRYKIVEAWAAGVPVVSTTLGAEGLPVRHGENVILADNAAEFASALCALLESSDLREYLGRS
jgi:glycosyltransferase involved in cell wall biosynthesis